MLAAKTNNEEISKKHITLWKINSEDNLIQNQSINIYK